jgi:hypothetical protein
MSGLVRVRVVASVIVAVVVFAVVPAAVARVQLTLPAAGLPGLHASGSSSRSARADLAAGLPSSLSSTAARAETQTSAAGGPSLGLRSDAFVFSSAAPARRVLAAWARLHHARRLAVGDRGYAFTRRTGHATVVVLAWRSLSRVGVLALTDRRGQSGALAAATEYAVLADSWLRSPLPTTAWARVLGQIRPGGRVSKATALQAFAVAYGPLPGVRTPAGRRTTIASGTLAAQWVASYWSKLSSAQRRVVKRRLGVPAPGVSAHAANVVNDPSFHPDPELQALAEGFYSEYETLLGSEFTKSSVPLTIVAGTSSDTVDAYADSFAFNEQGSWDTGLPATCRIRLLPPGQSSDPAFKKLVIAHETFHCIQFSLQGGFAWDPQPAWIEEGTADWAALTVDPISWALGGGNVESYIGSPRTPLFERSYDAVGFWGHVQDTYGDLWKRLTGIIAKPGYFDSYIAAGGLLSPFLTSWGSSTVRNPGTPAWEMTSPIVPPDLTQLGQPHTDIHGKGIVSTPPFTTYVYRVFVPTKTPLLHVTLQGYGRLGPGENYTDLGDAWFCTDPQGCQCPPNTIDDIPRNQPLSLNENGDTLLGISGDPASKGGTNGSLESVALTQFCKPQIQPPPPPGGGSGGSFGDPYITTFDGGEYGLQTTGEFTLVKSTVDDLEIQARLQPFPTSGRFVGDVAMNTAFAMRVGGAIVEVDNTTPGFGQRGALVPYLDRHLAHLQSGRTTALAGGGSVRYTPSQVTVTWPDGTVADVYRLLDHYGVNISVKPSAQRRARLAGLFGNDDGNPNNDYVGRDGRKYSAKLVRGFDIETSSRKAEQIVLGEFGASWRITPATSLFVYPAGKNTYSYIVKGFPARLISQQSLSPRQLAAARNACRRSGVTNAALLAGCIVDVGATGNRQLAAAAGAFQRATGLPPAKVDLSGRWSGHYSGAFNGTFILNWTQSGSLLHGHISLSSPHLTLGIGGAVSGSTIRFGAVGFVTYSGSVHGNSMSGTYTSPRGGGSWSATKV